MAILYRQAEKLLQCAGVEVNGPAPTDIQIKGDPEALLKRVFKEEQETRARLEAYMEGQWDVEDLTGLVTLLYKAQLSNSLENVRTYAQWLFQALRSYKQTKERGRQVAIAHYNMDNRLFVRMLDKLCTRCTPARPVSQEGPKTIEEAGDCQVRTFLP